MKLTWTLARRALLPLVALGGILFAVSIITRPAAADGAPPVAPPSASPGKGATVAGLGLIEPSSEVIAVASNLSGVVTEVFAQPGAQVAAGDPLFRLDAREAQATRATLAAQRQSALARCASAQAALEAASQTARAGAAGLAQAESAVRDARARLALFDTISDPRAVSTDERDRVRFALERAEAAAAEARGRSGASTAEVARARAQITEADAAIAEIDAQIGEIETTIARLTVRAPIAGEVLRVNVQRGEFAAAGAPSGDPLIALGATRPLHVRVQVDEEDIGRIAAGAAAEGNLRGDATKKVDLRFVRFEPQATPKRNLNGGAERVDTRVIEAIYAFDPARMPAFVGQQMDVFIAARPLAAAPAPAPAGRS
jgi:HlyD family secretion protein